MGGALIVAGGVDLIPAEERPEWLGKVAGMVEGEVQKMLGWRIDIGRRGWPELTTRSVVCSFSAQPELEEEEERGSGEEWGARRGDKVALTVVSEVHWSC